MSAPTLNLDVVIDKDGNTHDDLHEDDEPNEVADRKSEEAWKKIPVDVDLSFGAESVPVRIINVGETATTSEVIVESLPTYEAPTSAAA